MKVERRSAGDRWKPYLVEVNSLEEFVALLKKSRHSFDFGDGSFLVSLDEDGDLAVTDYDDWME